MQYQVKVDYQYITEKRDEEPISNQSLYLSESVKKKIIEYKSKNHSSRR